MSFEYHRLLILYVVTIDNRNQGHETLFVWNHMHKSIANIAHQAIAPLFLPTQQTHNFHWPRCFDSSCSLVLARQQSARFRALSSLCIVKVKDVYSAAAVFFTVPRASSLSRDRGLSLPRTGTFVASLLMGEQGTFSGCGFGASWGTYLMFDTMKDVIL